MTKAVFGLGFDVITDLTSIPIFKRSITIADSGFSYSFDCSKFEYKCAYYPVNIEMGTSHDETNANEENINVDDQSFFAKVKNYIIQLFTKKSPKDINRDRLSRSFYLSKNAYDGQFTSYSNTNYKNGALFSVLKSNTDNGIFKPAWYLGTHNKDLYVAIRGSNSIFDWLTDIQVSLTTDSTYSFHKGFYYAAKYVWNEIENDISKYKNDGYTIIFTGHSYGGSVAQILHYFAKKKYSSGVYSYVFGAAASMGNTPAQKIKETCFSFVYCNDIVPRIMNYVTYFKEHGCFSNEIIKTLIGESVGNKVRGSNAWDSSGSESITQPVGTIYHLPWKAPWSGDWGSISNTKTTINYAFYVYTISSIAHAIGDHNMDMYFKYLLYNDGLIRPEHF